MDDFNLSPAETKRIIAAYTELKEQADFYSMDIDLETGTLVRHRPKSFTWLDRWNERRREADFDERIDMEQE